MVLHPVIQAFTEVALAFVVLMDAGQLKLPTTVGNTENRAIITNIVTTIPTATCTSCIILIFYMRMKMILFKFVLGIYCVFLPIHRLEYTVLQLELLKRLSLVRYGIDILLVI